jgi:hypothetical protein
MTAIPLKSLADLPPPRSRLQAARDFAMRIGELQCRRGNVESRFDTMTPEGRQQIAEINRDIDRYDDWIATLIEGTPIKLETVLFDEVSSGEEAA